MSGQDLMQELQEKTALLDKALGQLGVRGRSYAEAERKYRVALAQKIVRERDAGTPVTIISDLCRGNQEIANLKFERDCSEVTYKAALEACNVYKLQLRLLENQVDREFRG